MDAATPIVLLAGPRRAGKSSIVRAVFGRVPPHETLFLEPSTTARLYLVGGGGSSSVASSEPPTAGLRLGVLDAPGDWLARWTQAPSAALGGGLGYGGHHPHGGASGGGGGGGGHLAPLPLSGAQAVLLLPDANEDDKGVTDHIDGVVSAALAEEPDGELAAAVAAAVTASDARALTAALTAQCRAQSALVTDSLGGAAVAARRVTLPESVLASSLASVLFVCDATGDEPYGHSDAGDALRGVAALLLGLARARWVAWGAAAEAAVLASDPAGALTNAEVAGRVARALARRFDEEAGACPGNPLHLPAVDVLIHKADGDVLVGGGGVGGGGGGGGAGGGGIVAGAGGADEARAELLRELSSMVGHELADAGFAPSIGGGGGGGGGQYGSGGSAGKRGGAGAADSAAALASTLDPSAPLPLPPLPASIPLPVAFYVTSLFDADGGGGGGGGSGGSTGGNSGGGGPVGGTPGGGGSVLEALSRVVQRVAPGPALLPAVEALLDAVVQSCGTGGAPSSGHHHAHATHSSQYFHGGGGSSSPPPVPGLEKLYLLDAPSRLLLAGDSNHLSLPEAGYGLLAECMDVAADIGAVFDPLLAAQAAAAEGEGGPLAALPGALFAAPDAGRVTSWLVRLTNGSGVYGREVAAAPGGGAGGTLAVAVGRAGSVLSPPPAAVAHAGSDGKDGAAVAASSLSLPARGSLDHNLRVLSEALQRLWGAKAAAAAEVAAAAAGAGAGVGGDR